MPRKTYRPQTPAESSAEITRVHQRFDLGMMSGPPASRLPDNAMAWLYNVVAFGDYLQGRYGTKVYRNSCQTSFPFVRSYQTGIPSIVGRDNLVGSKSGMQITSADAAFTEADVGNYWVWDDGTCEEIISVDSATQCSVEESGTREGDSCFIGGKHNGWHFHRASRKVVIQLATEIWVSDNIGLSSWSRAVCLSFDEPNNAVSQFDDIDNDSILIFNSNGMYKVVLTNAIPTMYRLNTSGPNTYITGNDQTESLAYCRRYIYSAMRLSLDANIRDRATTGVLIEQESSPNRMDSNKKDYGEVWSEYARGNDSGFANGSGGRTYGTVTGAPVVAASLDIGVWQAVVDGTLTLTINGTQAIIWVDFSAGGAGVGAGAVTSLQDVAVRIQIAMREYWPDSTCQFDAGRFILTSGSVPGSVFDAIADGVGGTPMGGAGFMNVVAGLPQNGVYYERALTLQQCTVPVQSVSGNPEWHYTHFGIYATLDLGNNGRDPVTRAQNDPERYIWVKDLRIAAAFFAYRNESGLVTASVGEFELADTGSVLEWENGDRDTITRYLSPTQAIVGAAGGAYGGEPYLGACAIGNGRVIRASQSGDRVQREGEGDFFTPDDERKTIFWANGYRSYIVEYINARQVRVHDTIDKAEQGITLDPTHRNFYDTINDDSLRPRQSDFLISNRAWEPLPLTNTGRLVCGWVFCAIRGGHTIYYAQHTPGTKYLLGAHSPIQENDDCTDVISQIEEFPNRIVVFCSNSVYGGPTNASVPLAVPGTGEFVNLFSGLHILDEVMGVTDWGSITRLTAGLIFAITSEPSPRIFDGFKWGTNLGEDADGREMVMDEIRSWQRASVAAFKDGELYLWGLR